MPRGKSRAHPTVKEQTEAATTVRKMSTAIRHKLDTELNVKGAEARQRILEKAPDVLTAIENLALGIRMVNAEGGTYLVAPEWQALKWLAEWYRQIIEETAPGKTSKTVHAVDDETKELLRKMVQTDRPALPEPEDGVYRLEATEFHTVDDEDEDDEND